MRVRIAWLAAVALLAAGCASVPPPASLVRPDRAAIERFVLDGRIAVRGAGQAYTARVSWRHDAASDEIVVSSPFGPVIAQLTGDAAGARLVTAERGTVVAGGIEELGREVFGFDLPLRAMPDWVLGRGGRGAGSIELDERSRIVRLVEQGWSIDYPEYESGEPQALPRRIHVQRGEVDVRLAVERWDLAQ